MQITVDSKGYVTCFCQYGGTFDNGIDIEEPKDFEHFDEHFMAYRYQDGQLEFDAEKDSEIKTEGQRNLIRQHRDEVCFPVINRGEMWYSILTDAQKEELKAWYTAWLDAPETLVEPEMPTWLKG